MEVKENNKLQFPDQYFDLVINKHEEYEPGEVNRVLKNGGVFLTQQVGVDDCNQINKLLGAPINDEYAHWELEFAEKQKELDLIST
ncbi:hypothetical protein BACCIP111883_02026 [Sutcliffiella rhizosphaerae]|uniref:Methyltransferase type 11 domain-containing protein n=1 Tax=Sutcliffiella rhizosphaerae TaxID=2880967 RepID=A0ABM8YN52_9BACI|nr:hypothetical protein BACCIP111883_02026 [Sutcliffiella rhizosphaerae]